MALYKASQTQALTTGVGENSGAVKEMLALAAGSKSRLRRSAGLVAGLGAGLE
ncbi:MAG: hypothetical protein AAGA37_20960 [Actinomycetota bacterium]